MASKGLSGLLTAPHAQPRSVPKALSPMLGRLTRYRACRASYTTVRIPQTSLVSSLVSLVIRSAGIGLSDRPRQMPK
jgi:hypothetical protein